MLKIAIIAGEPSGDLLAAALMVELKTQFAKTIEFIGIGGDKMKQAGLVSSYDMSILSVGGYGWDVISAIPKIYSMYRTITEQIIAFNPDVFIGVDAPGFNLRVEKKLKAHNIKTVHYVSPTIWAWRYERIYEIKKTTDLMLCIFPIEEAMYVKEHIPAKFIGHPLADQIELDIDTNKYRNELIPLLSDRYHTAHMVKDAINSPLEGWQAASPDGVDALNSPAAMDALNFPTAITSTTIIPTTIITALVGSRISEVKHLGKIFIEACNIIASQIPSIVFLFPFVNTKTKFAFENLLSQISPTPSFKYFTLLNQTSNAIKASDLVLAKSGTVTLEVALCKKPMVISYKVSKLTAWILKTKLKTKYVGQPNIMLDEKVAPEFLQDLATPANLAQAILDLYKDKKRQQYVINKFYKLHGMLRQNASQKAAKAVLDLIHEH